MRLAQNYSSLFESCARLSPRCGPVSLWLPSESYVPTSTAAGYGRHQTGSFLRQFGSSVVISKLPQSGRAHKGQQGNELSTQGDYMSKDTEAVVRLFEEEVPEIAAGTIE